MFGKIQTHTVYMNINKTSIYLSKPLYFAINSKLLTWFSFSVQRVRQSHTDFSHTIALQDGVARGHVPPVKHLVWQWRRPTHHQPNIHE